MSRAGEKLYGDWQRACDADDRQAPARRAALLRSVALLLLLLLVGGLALGPG